MPSIRSRRGFCACSLLLLYLTACGGRALNKNAAQKLIVDSPLLGMFTKEDVYIESVTQLGERDAIVETGLRAAFKLEKVKGDWVVREVRLGDRRWENLEDILRALQTVRGEETRRLIGNVMAAVERYHAANGRLPYFRNYVGLSDILNPGYLTPLVRLDAWKQPLAAVKVNSTTIRIISPGPDGAPGTSDDIEVTRTFP